MTPARHGRTVQLSGFRREPAAASARVTVDRPLVIQHATARGPVADNADTFLAAALLPAMAAGARLVSEAPVSAALAAGTERIQTVLADWYPGLARIEVDAPTIPDTATRNGKGVAAFFSGGVDSFYTALKHQDELDALVFIHGFDIRAERTTVRAKCSQLARAAAAALGKPLVEVETNVRSFSRRYVGWGLYHGSALASVALFLAGRFSRVYVPGSLSYDSYFPHGSHPLLDPLWTTADMELVYDGFEANRYEKTAYVASSSVALRFLRVCNRSPRTPGSGANCGRCEKCLRTMMALRILGVLDDCETFPARLELNLLAPTLAERDTTSLDLWEQNLQAAEEDDRDPELSRALRVALRNQGRARRRNHIDWHPSRVRSIRRHSRP
jgi:hypothetical protein